MDRITKYLIVALFIVGCGSQEPDCTNQRGDVAGDGTIDAFDAALALDIHLGNIEPTECQKWAADFNRDGRVTRADADAIYQYALNTPTSP